MGRARWQRFRQLCRYYRDCLRLDDHDRLRLSASRRGDSWAPLPAATARELGAGEGASVALPLAGPLVGFAATARRRADWCCSLGHPVVEQQRGGATWLVPVWIVPLAVATSGSELRLRREGPVLPNRAALDLLFADSHAQQACLERLGLVPPELGVEAQPPAPGTLGELADLLAAEGVLPAATGDEALLAVSRRGQYHRRLGAELRWFAEEADEEELEASALRVVFTDDAPHGAAAGDDDEPLVAAHALDPGQRRALRAVLGGALNVVTGPPGTGKSVMVRHALVNLALRGGSALVASHNHRALDAVEPALNALGDGESVIVRTSHHGHQRSWRHGLEELLANDDGALADPAAAAARYRDAQETVAAITADLGAQAAVADRYRSALADWRRALQALPAELRSRLADGSWDGPDEASLARWEAALGGAARPGLRGLLGSGSQRERAEAELDACWRALDLSEPVEAADDEPGDEHGADAAAGRGAARLALLRAAETCRQAWRRCRDLAERHRRLGVDREHCLRALSPAQRRAWRAGVDWLLERAAAGPSDPAERTALADLRAAVASFGLERWGAVYRDHFPLLLRQRPLWACSNLSAPATLPRRAGCFDLLVLDEASQCDIPGIIPLLFRCRRVVAVGDPQQLGHISRLTADQDQRLLAAHGLTALADQRFGYRGTSAWRLLRETPGAPEPILLAEHYRCHPQIAGLFNRAFYRSRLTIGSDAAALPSPPGRGAGVHWHQVRAPLLPVPHGASAPAEADLIVAELLALERAGYDGSIGVTTPFRAQVELLRARIAAACSDDFVRRSRLLVATAHGFQGDERDCLFFSLCGGEDLRAGAARFLAATPHLFNVAISRARAALHVVGDREWAARSGLPFLRELAAGACDDADPGTDAQPESAGERSLRAALNEAGIEVLPQYPVAGRRIDLAVLADDRRLAIEVDGVAHHATAAGERADDDCWRDLILTERGWRVLRFWHHEIRDRCPDCVARVLEVLAEDRNVG